MLASTYLAFLSLGVTSTIAAEFSPSPQPIWVTKAPSPQSVPPWSTVCTPDPIWPAAEHQDVSDAATALFGGLQPFSVPVGCTGIVSPVDAQVILCNKGKGPVTITLNLVGQRVNELADKCIKDSGAGWVTFDSEGGYENIVLLVMGNETEI